MAHDNRSQNQKNRQLLLRAFSAVVVLAFITFFISVNIPYAVVSGAALTLLISLVYTWLDGRLQQIIYDSEPWRLGDGE